MSWIHTAKCDKCGATKKDSDHFWLEAQFTNVEGGLSVDISQATEVPNKRSTFCGIPCLSQMFCQKVEDMRKEE